MKDSVSVVSRSVFYKMVCLIWLFFLFLQWPVAHNLIMVRLPVPLFIFSLFIPVFANSLANIWDNSPQTPLFLNTIGFPVFVTVWLFEAIILLSLLVGAFYIYTRIYSKLKITESKTLILNSLVNWTHYLSPYSSKKCVLKCKDRRAWASKKLHVWSFHAVRCKCSDHLTVISFHRSGRSVNLD